MHNQSDPLITAKDHRVNALGVPRVMQPLKGPFSASIPITQVSTPAVQPAQPTQPAQPPAQLPQLAAPQSQQDMLITRLLALPEMIRAAQADFDQADFGYREALAKVTIRAFSEPLFPGKKDGEGLRPASNDTEREAAIERLATTDSALIIVAQQREVALRTLMVAKNEFEAVKLVTQLLIAQSKN